MGAVQLNTRLDEDIKRAGDAVLAEYGVSSTEAIRSLWQYMALTGTLPDFVFPEENVSRLAPEAAEEGAGLAVRMMREMGFNISCPDPVTTMDAHIQELEELKEQHFTERYPSALRV